MGFGRTVLGVVAGAAAVGAAARWALGRQHEALLANPDRFTPEELAAVPDGDTVWLDRPDGTRIRCLASGPAGGPTVVLAHGYGISLREWNVVTEQLVARGHRVVAFDWRGHGSTTIGRDGLTAEAIAGDYRAVLEHFDVRDGVLVGHSTGGFVSIALLLEHPEVAERLAGLVLFAALAGDALEGSPQNRAQVPLITSGAMDRVVRNELLGMQFAATVYGADPSPAACRAFLDDFARQDHQALVPLLEQLTTRSFYDRLGEITVPTVVVCGELDATTPRWHSEALGRDIPGARNVWVPDAGHMLNWEAPEVLVDIVAELLEGAGVTAD